jgi:hypothetical protein
MSRVSDLLDAARSATSLEDFGGDSFREGLEILIRSADTEAKLTPAGREIFDQRVLHLLSCRLQVEDWYARHPEIDEQEIVAPLIGLGLPRTGSTALSCLLAEDPAVRFIRTWEGETPCPPPEAATQHTDPRIAKTTARIAWQDTQMPRLKAMLPKTATTPIECQHFMGYDFKSQAFQSWAQIPTYAHWLTYQADLVPTYRYVKRVLKLLQWRCPPNRWRLKNPTHILFMDALNEVFPDARFWMTHRDVANVLPSVADLYFELCQALSDDVDRAFLGRLNEEVWELGMRRLIAFRDGGQAGRFFDLHFERVQKDPIKEIEALYAWLGEPLTDEARRRMVAWGKDTPRDKHGRHDYDPAAFGIDIPKLQERFRFYSDRFEVATA